MYTPGPWNTMYDAVTQQWEIDQGYPNGIDAGIRIGKTNTQSINEQENNAKLIAAAPDLLEALMQELPHIQYVIDSLHKQGLNAGTLPEICNHFKAMVAKATE